ncbi:MAG TPA: hypothetical protein VJB08_03215 [Candidatus Nanoarchaeia archaeon]|nr:hypothetical protein [Candidatus Nanoarchaeia archaeon]
METPDRRQFLSTLIKAAPAVAGIAGLAACSGIETKRTEEKRIREVVRRDLMEGGFSDADRKLLDSYGFTAYGSMKPEEIEHVIDRIVRDFYGPDSTLNFDYIGNPR